MTSNSVRRGRAWLLLLVGLALAACDDDPSGPSQTGAVTINDYEFDPEDITVARGASVTWTWAGVDTHNVTFDEASITDSPTQSTGTYSVTMPNTAGTYTYHCTVHPVQMTGSIEVQ